MKKRQILKCHSINIEGPFEVEPLKGINDYFGKSYNNSCYKVELLPNNESEVIAKPIVRHFFNDIHSLLYKKCEQALENSNTVKILMVAKTLELPFGTINKEVMNNTFKTLLVQDELSHTVLVLEMYMQHKLFYTISTMTE